MTSTYDHNGVVRLQSSGAIRVQGEDAGAFLNAQLTNMVPATKEAGTCLAGWCDAKGRVQSLFRIIRHADNDFTLLLPTALVSPVIQRLTMFVLRAQVQITDACGDIAVLGMLGDAAAQEMVGLVSLPASGECLEVDAATLVGMPAGESRYLLVGSTRFAATVTPERELDENAWNLAQIRAGEPEVVAATQGQFVPQMLNLHWLDGIDFHKGCYPGQEVVAKLQFRGKLKRRVYRARTSVETTPGDSVADNGVSEGVVLQSAATPAGEYELLAVMRVDANPESLTVRDHPVTLLPLPYATPDA